MGFIFPPVSEMLAQSDDAERLSSHRQHLTPSSLVGSAGLLVEAVSFILDWIGGFGFCLSVYLFGPLLLF